MSAFRGSTSLIQSMAAIAAIDLIKLVEPPKADIYY